MGLAPLDVAALLDEVADLVRGDRQLALRADVQGGGDQEVVAPTLSFRRLRLSAFGYGHEALSRSRRSPGWDEKTTIIGNGWQNTRSVGREWTAAGRAR